MHSIPSDLVRRLLLAIIAVGGLTIIMHTVSWPTASLAERGLQNGLHAPAFGVLALIILFCIRRHTPVLFAYAIAATIAIFIGGVSELAQYFGERDADPMDLAKDVLGVSGFLITAASLDSGMRSAMGNPRPRITRLMRLTGAALILLGIWPTIWLTFSLAARQLSMPALATFENHWEREFYHSHGGSEIDRRPAPAGWPEKSANIVEVRLGTYSYPGFVVETAHDWSSYSALGFVAAVPSGAPLTLRIRLDNDNQDDQYDDSFHTDFRIDEEPQTVRLPLETFAASGVDLSGVKRIVIFTIADDAGAVLQFDDFRLIP